MLDLEAQLENLGIVTLVTCQLSTSARVQNVMKEAGGDCLSVTGGPGPNGWFTPVVGFHVESLLA